MTDVIKDFEEWYAKLPAPYKEDFMNTPALGEWAAKGFNAGHRACQQLNDNRIAIIEAEALRNAELNETQSAMISEITEKYNSLSQTNYELQFQNGLLDKRIADLEATIRNMAAVIALQRKQLADMVEMMDSGDEHGAGSPWHKSAVEALALTADGVELVEVGIAEFNKPDGTLNLDIDNIELDGVHKLYTIKQKGKQDGN